MTRRIGRVADAILIIDRSVINNCPGLIQHDHIGRCDRTDMPGNDLVRIMNVDRPITQNRCRSGLLLSIVDWHTVHGDELDTFV